MRSEEVRALGALAGGAAAGIAGQARDVHASIAGRVFGLLGPAGTATRLVHDQVTGRAYAGAHSLTGALVRASAYAYGLTRREDTPALETCVRAPGATMVGVSECASHWTATGTWAGPPTSICSTIPPSTN